VLFTGDALLLGAALTVSRVGGTKVNSPNDSNKAAATIPLTLNPEIVENILDNDNAA
jgi:hypothetical protein